MNNDDFSGEQKTSSRKLSEKQFEYEKENSENLSFIRGM